MEFIDFVRAKDAAVERDDSCAESESLARAALEDAIVQHQAMLDAATSEHQASQEARLAAHQAIHDLLVERGEHYLIDDNGTLTVFKAIDEAPGYIAVHPIPGTMPTMTAKAK